MPLERLQIVRPQGPNRLIYHGTRAGKAILRQKIENRIAYALRKPEIIGNQYERNGWHQNTGACMSSLEKFNLSRVKRGPEEVKTCRA